MTDRFNQPDYLKNQQYHNANKLSARIRLHQEYSTNPKDIFDWQWDFVLQKAPQTARVLEVGTGRGDMWRVNRDRVPAGWEITLTDFSDGMLKDNQKLMGEWANRFSYQQADVQELHFPDKHFDIVFANYMLYHVPNIPQGIAELRRVLKSDGILYAITNGDHHMRELFELAATIDPNISPDLIFRHAFSLDNGADYLSAHFKHVQRDLLENSIEVNETQPIMDYIASMISLPGEYLTDERSGDLKRELDARIAKDGKITIRKESGTFIAFGE